MSMIIQYEAFFGGTEQTVFPSGGKSKATVEDAISNVAILRRCGGRNFHVYQDGKGWIFHEGTGWI